MLTTTMIMMVLPVPTMRFYNMTQKGFTLVELLIVVLIIGGLMTIAVPRIVVSAEGAKISACRNNIQIMNKHCRNNIQIMNKQIEKFKIDTDRWPDDLGELTKNPDYFPDGPPQCPFGVPYNMNEPTHRVIRHKHVLTSKNAWVLKHFTGI